MNTANTTNTIKTLGREKMPEMQLDIDFTNYPGLGDNILDFLDCAANREDYLRVEIGYFIKLTDMIPDSRENLICEMENSIDTLLKSDYPERDFVFQMLKDGGVI